MVKRKKGFEKVSIHLWELHKRWEAEYKALQTKSDKTDWLAQKIEDRKVINAHAKRCEVWEVAERAAKRALINERKDIIIERAKTLGWDDELSKVNYKWEDLKSDPFIEKTCQKVPNDCVLRKIDNYINEFMEVKRHNRLYYERRATVQQRLPILREFYSAYVSTYPVGSILPTSADVYLDPLVQDLIVNTPSTTPFTVETLAEVEAAFPDIILRWRKKMEEELLNMIAQSCGTENTSESILELPTTIFSCKSCPDEPLTYPQVLVHHCAIDPEPHGYSGDLYLVQCYLGYSYWNTNNSIFFEAQKF